MCAPRLRFVVSTSFRVMLTRNVMVVMVDFEMMQAALAQRQ